MHVSFKSPDDLFREVIVELSGATHARHGDVFSLFGVDTSARNYRINRVASSNLDGLETLLRWISTANPSGDLQLLLLLLAADIVLAKALLREIKP